MRVKPATSTHRDHGDRRDHARLTVLGRDCRCVRGRRSAACTVHRSQRYSSEVPQPQQPAADSITRQRLDDDLSAPA
ncbi:hypothetical protein STTU_3361 [Streptomyces sp. Tu6071]|nr:hypothetical protein STTU_3361 [Streptomyces sp. Tu6071]